MIVSAAKIMFRNDVFRGAVGERGNTDRKHFMFCKVGERRNTV